MINFKNVYPRIENYLKQEKVFLSKLAILDKSVHQPTLMDRLNKTEELQGLLINNPSISNIDFQEIGNQLYRMDKSVDVLILKILLKENPDLSRASIATIPLILSKPTV